MSVVLKRPGLWISLLVFVGGAPLAAEEHAAPRDYGQQNPVVRAQADGTLVCEAEEFQVESPGWRSLPWGTNYYAGTFANTFLSRKAYLGAPEQSGRTVATRTVEVPQAGRYLALVRYEAAYRFDTQFRLQIEQNGRTVFDRLYGARNNLKVWAFGERLKTEVAWSWGAGENIVWEGHDAFVNLQAGPAKLSLIADRQPEPAARRNVDLVMLTTDLEQVRNRIEKESYLPLDGMLTQAGDLFLRLHNQAGEAVMLTVPPGTEHSPYWVHLRTWQPKTIAVESGQSSEWVEVGSLLDSLNDGQWTLTAASDGPLHYTVEFGVPRNGNIEPIGRFEHRNDKLHLAYDADTRYTGRIRLQEQVLYDLVEYLKQHPVPGKFPERTLIYGYTFTPQPENARYTAALEEFRRLLPITETDTEKSLADPRPGPRGYTDVRSLNTEKLEEYLQKLQAEGNAEKMAVVSLGDEIGLPQPPAGDHGRFHQWLQKQGLQPGDVVPGASGWDAVTFSPAAETAGSNPRLFYYSRRYRNDHGIEAIKERTDLIRRYLPNAGVGANFSPHHGHHYLGETHKWVHLFRRDGMTMPWSEDYIWQVPVGSQQMNFINLDLFRAGLKGKPDGKIHYYVMPHAPGTTTANWRRQFFGDLAHGMKIVNLFEFRPVQAAYTENHVSDPEMYLAIRRAFHELETFEDIIQEGQVRRGEIALWFGETGDIWDDNAAPFGAGKRSLYIALLHQQLPLDFVIEEDAVSGDLKDYRVLYLTDRHVSRAASEAIAEWVKQGGRLFATAGAGMLDEFNQPNTVLRNLLGIEPIATDAPADQSVTFIKQDLAFLKPLDTVRWKEGDDERTVPVFSVRSRVRAANAEVVGVFADGSPAVTVREVGQGTAVSCGFLPGLSYFHPALPLRPMDRNPTEQAMGHFIPTEFDRVADALIGLPAADLARPVACSEPLVETRVIEAKQGAVIPLVNWSAGPLKDLTVTVNLDLPAGNVRLASGNPVKATAENGQRVFTIDLDVADALILR